MRFLPEIIDAMIQDIPSENIGLIGSLECLAIGCIYTAPECSQHYWTDCSIFLFEAFEGKDASRLEEWQIKVLSTFVGYDVRKI